MSIVRCPSCGRDKVSDSASACPDCGYNVKEYYENNPKKIVCPECGKEDNVVNAKFCADCGFQLTNIGNSNVYNNNNIYSSKYSNYQNYSNNPTYIRKHTSVPNGISDKWLWSLAIIPSLASVVLMLIVYSNPLNVLFFFTFLFCINVFCIKYCVYFTRY